MPRVEFESAYNLLVAIALIESEKTVLEQILAGLISEPTQKTALKFKVYVNALWIFSGSTLVMDHSTCLQVLLGQVVLTSLFYVSQWFHDDIASPTSSTPSLPTRLFAFRFSPPLWTWLLPAMTWISFFPSSSMFPAGSASGASMPRLSAPCC